jgi:hypothetical protein
VTLLEGSPSDIVKQMKTFLLLPLGLGTVLGLLGACSNEPSSTLLTIPSRTPQPNRNGNPRRFRPRHRLSSPRPSPARHRSL